jgi:thymidylate synthase ThyX
MKIVSPSVELVSHTPDALELLIFTKSTRLQGRQTLDEIKAWPLDKKIEHLNYMRDTIKSSWEFINYTFLIRGVSRAFTHQFVRTRDQAGIDDPAFGMPDANPAVASFAQESQRTVDISDNGFVLPTTLKEANAAYFVSSLEYSESCYETIKLFNEPSQNARSLMPMAVATSIIAQLSLRALHHVAEVRLCTRTQGEYQNVFRMMRQEVYEVHPWAEGWIEVYCVNHGTCCFPRYKECPIAALTLDPESVRSKIKNRWERIQHEATPVAADAKTT